MSESEDWGRPAFAATFPADPELEALVVAFARGDYRTVRSEAPALAARTTDPAIKSAAELLRARIEPDPTAKFLFVLGGALLVALSTWWLLHDGRHGGSREGAPAPAPGATVEFVR